MTSDRRESAPAARASGAGLVVLCLCVGLWLVSGCERSEAVGSPDAETEADAGGGRECGEFRRQLAEVRDERDALASKRDRVRDRVADLEEAAEQLETFEPNLVATTLHIYPSTDSPVREIGGHVRNGTDETVALMHIETRLVPEASDIEPVERQVAYELKEPLEGGEVQHAPYGQQIIDAYPDVETEVWSEGTLEIEVMALEGPNGDVLWDQRGRDREALERRREESREDLEQLDERIESLQKARPVECATDR